MVNTLEQDDSERVVLYLFTAVDFYSQSCNSMLSLLDRMDLGRIGIVKINIDTMTQSDKNKYKVKGVPVLVLTINDVEIRRMQGVANSQQLLEFLGLTNNQN